MSIARSVKPFAPNVSPLQASGISIPGVNPNGSVLDGTLVGDLRDRATDLGNGAWDTVTNTDFLVNAGIGLIAGAFASKVKRPSLSFPALSASLQVALGVGQALKAGASTIQEITNAGKGFKTSVTVSPQPVNLIRREAISKTVEDNSSPTLQFLKYPKDLSSKYCFEMSLYDYKRLDGFPDSSQSNPGLSNARIKLPLPTNLVDVISLQYNNLSMGPIRGPLFDIIKAAANTADSATSIQNFGTIVSDTTANIIKKITEDSSVARLIGRQMLQGVSPTTAAAVDLALGNTPNPHQVVTFSGVNLRSFQFSWRLSPNNKDESLEIQRIILLLKQKTLPKKDSEFLLKYPNYVKLKLHPEQINTLFRFRTMVVDSFTINYAPSGSVAFHGDDSPVEYEISMAMREVDIQTSEDYDEALYSFVE